MSQTLRALFDGQVFRPETPPDLEPNTSYLISIQDLDADTSPNAWDVLSRLAGTVEAPEDWASEHDHYLYGTDKRGATPEAELSE